MGAREYITWAGKDQYPTADLFPGWSKTAGGATVVHSPAGYCWKEEKDPQQLAILKLSEGVARTALQVMNTAPGAKILYFDALDTTTPPPVAGDKAGFSARGRNPESREIVSEWVWDGSQWNRLLVSNTAISNLDVGKLTAGAADIQELAARKLAAATAQVIELDVSHLTASDAHISSAVIDKLWTDNIKARLVETDGIVTNSMIATGAITANKITVSKELTANIARFLKVTTEMLESNAITAEKISAGALDGKIITSAVIQTEHGDNRGVKFTSAGVQAWDTNGNETLRLNGAANKIVGRLYTGNPGQPGLIAMNSTSAGNRPAIFFSLDGQAQGDTAAIYLTDKQNGLVIRNNMTRDNGGGPIVTQPGLWVDQTLAVASPARTATMIQKGMLYASPETMISHNSASFGGSVQIDGSTPIIAPNMKRGTFAANLGIATVPKGHFYWLSSAKKYKLGIRDAQRDGVNPHDLLKLRPRTWIDRTQAEDHAKWAEDRADGGANSGNWDYAAEKPGRIPGLVAEEVIEAGLGLYATYSANGQVEGLQYDRLWTLLIPVVREQEERIKNLEAEINELKEKHQ